MDRARIKESTRARYRASIERCATRVAEGRADAPFGLFLAFELAEAFVDHPDPERRVRPITAANYVDALIAVGRKAGIAPVDDLDTMSVITQELSAEADAQGKLKRGRIHELMSRGGFAHARASGQPAGGDAGVIGPTKASGGRRARGVTGGSGRPPL
ncbi:hypothetical protein [Rhodosalinus sp.]|uniref:hypothetical protein n=1 Tax=Rhodosalinus sp. TaxID=2047741 RepID=UPI0035642E1D